MNVSEDKMTNHWGIQIEKPSLTCCVPVLLIVSRRLKHEYILLDVVKWVLSKSIKERGLFYHFWSISRYNLNKDFMFLENESKLCECRVNLFFLADKSTPTCLFLHTDYHYPYNFMSPEYRYMRFLYFYCHVLWLLLFVNFWRFDQFYEMFSPDDKKKKKKQKQKRWIHGSIL